MNSNYFSVDEFASPDLDGSGINMDKEFISKLDKARQYAAIPFKISSGYRTKEHNKNVGGVPDSAHTKGHAADIVCSAGVNRFIIVTALLEAGFNRIGIANSFIHVDDDPSKPKHCIWTY